ncbi:MAG: HAD family hydrolase [Actinomycetes bacterium]
MPVTTLLLDVDGVLQSGRPDLADVMERAYEWRDGYAAFQDDLFGDDGYLATLTEDSEVLGAIQRVLDRHAPGVDAATVHDQWASLTEVNHDLVALLDRVAVEQVFLATNQEARMAEVVEQSYGGFGWLTGALVSCRLGVRKPHAEFFSAVLDRLAVPAADCLFVDDKQACVVGAASLGIAAVRFDDTRQLAAELTGRGLLPPLP